MAQAGQASTPVTVTVGVVLQVLFGPGTVIVVSFGMTQSGCARHVDEL